MIRYTLVCNKRHEFESWFQNSAAYDKQAKRGLVACPHCGTTKVEKEIMSPRLAGARKRDAAPRPSSEPANDKTPVAMVSPQEHELRKKLKELRQHLTQNS